MTQDRVGRFEVLTRLAVGIVADVFLARDGDGEEVIVKRLLTLRQDDPAWRIRMTLEGRLGALCSHPGVVRTLEVGEADGLPYVVLERLEGEPLEAVVQRVRRPPPVAVAVHIVRQLLKALQHVHTRKDDDGGAVGIVHRDVCPANLMVREDGAITLFDFGVAVQGGHLETYDPGVLAGRPAYLSPEAARGMPIDRRLDVWSAGVVLYELLTGERLFLRANPVRTLAAVAGAPIPPPSRLRPEVDKGLDAVVFGALQREPAMRFSSAKAFGSALADWAEAHGGDPGSEAVATWAERHPTTGRAAPVPPA